jgi:hypothetical protein
VIDPESSLPTIRTAGRLSDDRTSIFWHLMVLNSTLPCVRTTLFHDNAIEKKSNG